MTAATVLDFPNNPSAMVATITPEVAQRWLDQNTHNRSVRGLLVSQYARDMSAGNWAFTGEAIKFTADGTLLDGQHRLLAVVKSGATITALVVNGLNPDAQKVMDSGAKRQVSDMFKLAGLSSPTVLASSARIAMAISNGRNATVDRSMGYSHTEIAMFVAQNPGIADAAAVGQGLHASIDAYPSVLAYVWWRLSRVSMKAANEFFESIANSQTDGKGDPRAALIRRLGTARRNNEKLSQFTQVSLFFRAWNAWRKGLQVGSLPTTSRDGGPVAIPVPR